MDRSLKSLPIEIQKRYEKWQDIVRHSGPHGLQAIRGFRDEALRGVWKGHRSSRLDRKHRVIYRVDAEVVRVMVVDVTAHDYRKQ
ncbi:MAG: type II toxin-antitoxin system mRNA interferase toxin, RelE/StbE family [Lysobacterales bacterium]